MDVERALWNTIQIKKRVSKSGLFPLKRFVNKWISTISIFRLYKNACF